MQLRDYYHLTKPGIVYGNLFSMLAGFLFAARGVVAYPRLIAATIGLGLVIAGACVWNNFFDRTIDRKMARTKARALVTGAISVPQALAFGTFLDIVGLAILIEWVNVLSACIALFGVVAYLGLYGYAKRTTHWGTVVGSISGAVPIVVGYTAATGRLDLAALLLFLIMVTWQMPHFYAIALYRREEYAAAGIPVLPLVKSHKTVKLHILVFVLAYLALISLPSVAGLAGGVYLFVVLVVGFRWLLYALQGFHSHDDAVWGRKLFRFSLVVLVISSLALAFGSLLP